MNLRNYRSGDKDSCLKLFDGNSPKFFRSDERPDFEDFLDSLDDSPDCPYFVLEDQENRIVGCGGIWIDEYNETAVLCWGMVDRSHHREGIGRLLLLARLDLLCNRPEVKIVKLDTSQNSRGFFEKEGFRTFRFIPNYYGSDLDRYDMQSAVNEERLRSIHSRFLELKTKMIEKSPIEGESIAAKNSESTEK